MTDDPHVQKIASGRVTTGTIAATNVETIREQAANPDPTRHVGARQIRPWDEPGFCVDAAIAAFPEAFDERQRPRCGYWNEHLGPCICGDPSRHRGTP